MGWGRYLLLGDLGQQLDLSDQQNELAEMRSRMQRERASAADTQAAIRQLQAENDELRLYLAALVRLMTAKGLATSSEIRRLVESIDAEDGSADGKFDGPIV